MDASISRKRSGRETSPDSARDERSFERNKQPRLELGSTSPLCQRCEELDLELEFKKASEIFQEVRDGLRIVPRDIWKATDGRYYYQDAILIHRFDESLSEFSNCCLCEFFRSLRLQPGRHKRYKLLAFRSSDSWHFQANWMTRYGEEQAEEEANGYKDSVFMVVAPDVETFPPCGYDVDWMDHDVPEVGAIYCVRPEEDRQSGNEKQIITAEELGDEPNFEFARDALRMCQKSHGSCCKRRASDEPILRGFRLIDCTKEPPVVEEKPWGATYCALSYVWGSTAEDQQDWPETVINAVEVTKKLGLQYLWIDRLCINQANQDEKAYLISRMGTIYQEAEFTIVAAAGSGASYGLPGVRRTSRRSQPKYYLNGGSVLLSILRDPRRDIRESKYWTRGWTYQEGVLSNRRIVFTDEQIYWECHGMAIHESAKQTIFNMAVAESEENSEYVMADFMLSGIFKADVYSGSLHNAEDSLVSQDDGHRLDHGFPTQQNATVRSQLRGLNEHIREFSKRNLTCDTDTLSAIQGIFGLYAQTTELYLFHGLPMWMRDIVGDRPGAQITFALSVSSWYHRTDSNQSMFVSEACRRKTHLPSWTWAGWAGTVSWRAPPQHEHAAYMSDLINADSLKLLWAARVRLCGADPSDPICLEETHSAVRLAREAPTLIQIKHPILLSQFERREETKKQWGWQKPVGRTGRIQHTLHKNASWDVKWYRIGRRLSCVGMSIAITEQEWTAKHASGELISVLMFAGKNLTNEHGTARFLTLRKTASSSPSGPERWERVGTLYLTIPFNYNISVREFLEKIPARKQINRNIVIQ